MRRRMTRRVGAGAVAGTGLTAYAVFEARAYTLRRVDVPVLPPGQPPAAGAAPQRHPHDAGPAPQAGAGCAASPPSSPTWSSTPATTWRTATRCRSCCDASAPLLDGPGVFVLGSNDYFAPTLRNPVRYLLPDDGKRHTDTPQLPWPELRDGFAAAGWVDLTNRRGDARGRADVRIAFAGVDDPHLRYDRLDEVAGPADADADVRLGVTHAPYLRVLDQYAADGYDAVLAGHTHGGQVCLPGVGALTTNCDLEPPAPRACTATRPPRDPATPGRRGCTSRPASAPARTPGSGSPAAPRRPC